MRLHKTIPAALLLAGVVAPPPADAAVSDAVVIALNSVKLDRDANVVGEVVVNDTATAPTLEPGFELSIDRGVTISGAVRADSADIDGKATVNGAIECNDGDAGCAGLALPVFAPLPPFRAAVPADGSGSNCQPGGDCFVASGTQALAPGAYRDISVAPGATVELSQGGYDAASFSGGNISFTGAALLRVAGDASFSSGASITAGAGLSGRDVIIYVGGNVEFGKTADVAANFHVAGLFHMDRDSSLSGSVIAFDADFDRNADLDLDSAFNLAPTADGQTVETLGVDPIVITLTGSDPDGDSLTFTIVSGPSAGAITAGPTQVDATSATVTYDADVEGAADQFVFQVDDGKGGTDIAVVDINPVDDPPDPPGLDGILAKDDEIEVTRGASDVPVTLVAAAPIAPEPNALGDLTFAIISAPDQGGSVTTPVATAETPVRSATVEYTPDPGFTGIETFGFQACEAAMPTNCDQAIITVNVETATPPAPPVALDQSVTTAPETRIDINLAIPEGQEAPSSGTGRSSLCGNGDLDQGEQCDDGNLVNGDGCDDQCRDELQ
jgi:cysteine-rich repeat protein